MLTRLTFSRLTVPVAPLFRGSALVCLSSMVIFGSVACSGAEPTGQEHSYSLRAGENLLSPSSSQTFVIQPDPDTQEQAPGEHFASPYAANNSEVSGSLVVTDGMITHIDLTASLESPNDLRFELTNPALFERRGEILDRVTARGTLSTDTAVYHNVKIIFVPDPQEEGVVVDAELEVPESFASDEVAQSTNIHLRLLVAPEVTEENHAEQHSAPGNESIEDDVEERKGAEDPSM